MVYTNHIIELFLNYKHILGVFKIIKNRKTMGGQKTRHFDAIVFYLFPYFFLLFSMILQFLTFPEK